MIRKTLLAALTILSTQHAIAQGQAEMDGLVNTLTYPAAWRALGTLDPGNEDGVQHDVYRNSALLAAVIHSQGVKVPFVKLDADPQQAREKFKAYLVQALSDKGFSADDKSCGVGVSHLYGSIFSLLLRSKGPQWVTPGISDQDAAASASKSASLILPAREMLAKLCNTYQYRPVAEAFDGLLKRVEGEMPYLLNQGLRLNQIDDERRNAQRGALAQDAIKNNRSRDRSKAMLRELASGNSVISDPFGACVDLPNDSNAILKNQCMSKVLSVKKEQQYVSYNASLAGISKERTDQLTIEQGEFEHSYYELCNKVQAAGRQADESDQESAELFARCSFVQLSKKEADLKRNPPQTDAQLSADLLKQANDIAAKGKMSAQDKAGYLKLINQSNQLGNVDAKLVLAQYKSLDINDIQALDSAEKLLNQVERASGVSPESSALRQKIAGPLQAYRFAHSPAQLRKTYHESLGAGSDDAERAAVTMDVMSRNGGACDTFVVQAYSYATNKSLAENIRVMVIEDKLLDTAAKVGCIR